MRKEIQSKFLYPRNVLSLTAHSVCYLATGTHQKLSCPDILDMNKNGKQVQGVITIK